MKLEEFIRAVPDFPKKGIIFKDITPLLSNPAAFHRTINILARHYKEAKIDKIVSMEARGFIFGSALAYRLKCGFIPVRKKGKLPYQTVPVTYQLEYGTDTLEIHEDAFKPGEKILIMDDVLATGGTAKAVVELVKKLKGKVVGLAFLLEIPFLKGRQKLTGYKVFTLL